MSCRDVTSLDALQEARTAVSLGAGASASDYRYLTSL
jgi:hypothetical protein